MSDVQLQQVQEELKRIQSNCLYNAQAYFEAAKSAELWGRLMVFLPASVTAVTGLLVAVGAGKEFGALAAVAGAVAATASFLGSTKKATDFLASARSYTALRHKVHSELSFLRPEVDFVMVQERAREFNEEYIRIAATDIPVPNNKFAKASKRIERGAAA
ncbi:hypothetical protein ACQSMD_05450 [Streptomyces flavovirens]|uniref:hypothetical protein n=1 Tax=Streptomyces flavovirens TaxID=52258 RepID=UPI003D12F719